MDVARRVAELHVELAVAELAFEVEEFIAE
jgi:hypothetical protein